jgi:hypothetical protein
VARISPKLPLFAFQAVSEEAGKPPNLESPFAAGEKLLDAAESFLHDRHET